jgi:hypothetical protein
MVPSMALRSIIRHGLGGSVGTAQRRAGFLVSLWIRHPRDYQEPCGHRTDMLRPAPYGAQRYGLWRLPSFKLALREAVATRGHCQARDGSKRRAGCISR